MTVIHQHEMVRIYACRGLEVIEKLPSLRRFVEPEAAIRRIKEGGRFLPSDQKGSQKWGFLNSKMGVTL